MPKTPGRISFHRPEATVRQYREKRSESTLTIILVNIKIHRIEHKPATVSLMYVCLCTGVTDGQIRDAIYEGCCSYKEVRQATGVASQCGKCACLAKEVVRETLTKLQTAQAAIPFRRIYSSVNTISKNRTLSGFFMPQINRLGSRRGTQTFLFLLIFIYYSIT
jgi:bacterioferritin-associated ferredoxin